MEQIALEKRPETERPAYGKKILIIRSAARVFGPTLKALKDEFPRSRITVLAPKNMEEGVLQDPLVDEVVSPPTSGRMSLFICGRKVMQNLRSKRFDLAVSLYNVEWGLGYSNIDLIAWATQAREVRGYNSKGKYVSLPGKEVFKKIVREKASGAWVGINIGATVFLFSVITLGLILEWCYRSLFQSKSPNDISFQDKK